MFVLRSYLPVVLLTISTLVCCSTPKSSETPAPNDPAESDPAESNPTESDPAEAARSSEKDSAQHAAKASSAPTSGPFACATKPGLFWADSPGDAAAADVDAAAKLRFELPDGLKAIEPPKNAGKPIKSDSCTKASYSTRTQSLLSVGHAFPRCCTAKPRGADFRVGCMAARGCTLTVPTADGPTQVQTRSELADAIAPIDTVSEAVGLAAVTDRHIWVPYGAASDARIADANQFFDWQPTRPMPVAVEADKHPWGWVLRLPAYRRCGCKHDLYRVAYRVTRQAQVCRLAETPVRIARVKSGTALCVD